MDKEMKLIDEACQSDILRGYSESEDGYRCLICGEHFTKGEIYQLEDKLFDAHRAILIHIKEEHQSVLDALLKSPSSSIGISELQLGLITLFTAGLSDKQIAEQLGVAGSTIRNHRYKLREKEKQAKLFLSIMQLLEAKQNGGIKVNKDRKEYRDIKYRYIAGYDDNEEELGTNQKISVKSEPAIKKELDIKDGLGIRQKLDIRKNNSIDNDDYIDEDEDNISQERKLLKRCINEHGRIRRYPHSHTEKKVILQYIIAQFKKGKMYMDSEVNTTLMSMYIDYEVIKKELLEYGLLCRSDKGGVYWVKGA